MSKTWTNYLIHVANNIDKWKLYQLAYNQSRKEKLFTSCPTVSKDNKLFEEIPNRNERNYLIHVANNKGQRGCANESVSFRKILPWGPSPIRTHFTRASSSSQSTLGFLQFTGPKPGNHWPGVSIPFCNILLLFDAARNHEFQTWTRRERG